MKNYIDIENKLRSGKLPDSDMSKHRMKVWQKIRQVQRQRRKFVSLFSIPPMVWAFGSIVIITILFVLLFLLKK